MNYKDYLNLKPNWQFLCVFLIFILSLIGIDKLIKDNSAKERPKKHKDKRRKK